MGNWKQRLADLNCQNIDHLTDLGDAFPITAYPPETSVL